MNKKTITKEFQNIYGNGGPLNYKGVNKSMNNLLKQIPNKDGFENNATKEYENVVKETNETPYGIIILLIVMILVLLAYYFRNTIYNILYPTPQTTPPTTTTQKPTQTTLQTIKTDEDKHKELQQNITKGGVNQLNDKINTVSPFKQEQLVKENSYCYIGTDNGQRECTNAFEGDVCMSGQIFPKMAVCVNPHLNFK